MDSPLPLSVALITFNEEENLPRCLRSVQRLAAEIVIVDSGSKDRTGQIAAEFGARFEVSPWSGFAAQKEKALQLCSQEWVLCIDADEVLTPELQGSISKCLKSGPAAEGYELNRRTFYLGDWVWHCWYPDWIVRLVRKRSARWGGLDPHAALEVKGRVEQLEGDLLHYSFKDLYDHLQRTIKYARTMAESLAARGKRFSWGQFFFSPPMAFVKHLLLKHGWRDGWRGWLISFVKFVDVFAKYAFLLERERTHRSEPEKAAASREQGVVVR